MGHSRTADTQRDNLQGRSTTGRRYGPMIRILASRGSITIAVGALKRHRDLALRMAHDIHLNHRLDVNIMSAAECVRPIAGNQICGSLVVVGGPSDNEASRALLNASRFQAPGMYPARVEVVLATRSRALML